MNSFEIEHAFTYQKPKKEQISRIRLLLDSAKKLGALITAYTPKSREQSLAFTKLQECIMWANAAIVLNEEKKLRQEDSYCGSVAFTLEGMERFRLFMEGKHDE